MKKGKTVVGLLVCCFIILFSIHNVFAETDASMRAQQIDLNILWEVKVGANDGMTTTNYSEAAAYPMIGQMYYVPKDSSASKNPIYRLFNRMDHILSTSSDEGGYLQESIMGYPWKKANKPTGTANMLRGFNSSTGDHAAMSNGYMIPRYSIENFVDNYYAYHRYGGNETKLYELAGSKINIKSNLVAGGGLWNWTWKGKQFLDTLDYGRFIQSSLSIDGCQALPTEAGDCYADSNKQFMHGSPIQSYSNVITASSKIQNTLAIPLEWQNFKYNGNVTHTPTLYYKWLLGKSIKLDDTSLDLGREYNYLKNQVAQYTTILNTPNGLTNANIEIPTGYLKSEFKRAFTFDSTVTDLNAAAHEVADREFAYLGNATYHYQYNPEYGGVIYATSDLKYAMGIYGSKPTNGGSASYFTLWKFGSSVANPDVTKWSACYGTANISTGEIRFKTYIISGTYDDVRTAMRRLYIMGYR